MARSSSRPHVSATRSTSGPSQIGQLRRHRPAPGALVQQQRHEQRDCLGVLVFAEIAVVHTPGVNEETDRHHAIWCRLVFENDVDQHAFVGLPQSDGVEDVIVARLELGVDERPGLDVQRVPVELSRECGRESHAEFGGRGLRLGEGALHQAIMRVVGDLLVVSALGHREPPRIVSRGWWHREEQGVVGSGELSAFECHEGGRARWVNWDRHVC